MREDVYAAVQAQYCASIAGYACCVRGGGRGGCIVGQVVAVNSRIAVYSKMYWVWVME